MTFQSVIGHLTSVIVMALIEPMHAYKILASSKLHEIRASDYKTGVACAIIMRNIRGSNCLCFFCPPFIDNKFIQRGEKFSQCSQML